MKKKKRLIKIFFKRIFGCNKKNSDEKGNTKTNAFLLQDTFFFIQMRHSG